MVNARVLAVASFSIFVSIAACGGSDASVGQDADGGNASDASGGGRRDGGGATRDGGSTSGSDSGTTDSGTTTGAFACAGASLPTTAPASITVGGTAYEQASATPTVLSGASISAYPTQTSTTASDTVSSGASGDFSLTVGTGGVPVDGYLKATKAGDVDSYLYPNAPLAADIPNLRVLVLTTTTFGFLPSLAGATQDGGKGVVGILVLDCDGNPVQGATVSSSPGGDVRYNDASGPSATASSTAADGIAYIFNVPTGDVTLSGMAGSVTLRSHHLVSRTNVFTTTLITP